MSSSNTKEQGQGLETAAGVDEALHNMDADACLSVSFHNMDVASDELDGATERFKPCCMHQPGKDVLSESEIHQRFVELWHEKGELLMYKAFVSRYPGCALLYDQICGSIPPEVEVEIVASEMFDDSLTDTNNEEYLLDEGNEEHVHSDGCTKEHHQCDSDNKEHLYGNTKEDREHLCNDNREHLYSCASSKEHLYTEASNKEHLYGDSNNKEHLYTKASNKEHLYGDFNNKEHLYTKASNKEHLYGDFNNKEHLYTEASNKEHLYGNSNNKEHLYTEASNKEHLYADSNNKEHLYTKASNKEHLYGDFNNKEHLYSDASSKEHLYSDSSNREPNHPCSEESVHSQEVNKEHIDREIDNKVSQHGDAVGKKYFNFDRDNKEHSHSSDNAPHILLKGTKRREPLQDNCNSEEVKQSDSDSAENIHDNSDVEENVEKQLHGNECINNDCDMKAAVCDSASNKVHSELDQNYGCPTEFAGSGEITLKHGVIFDADIQSGRSFTEASNLPCQASSCSDSDILSVDLVSSVRDVSSAIPSTAQADLEEGNISQGHSDAESQPVLPVFPHEEHCYTSGSFHDHSYTGRNDLSNTAGDCQDCFAVDGQDVAEEFGHEELISRLKEAHEDLKNQVYSYIREIFGQWVRRNPDVEFDVSSLDEDLIAVANPFLEVEIVNVEFVDEQ